MKTGFKKYDSSYKRKESPFTRLSVGIGITTGPPGSKERGRIEQRKRDESNKEELLAKAKGRLIKKAERKESKAAKRREQGREVAAARKTRKATKLRKQAGELTADQVVRRREQMRDSAERRQERTRSRITPFTSLVLAGASPQEAGRLRKQAKDRQNKKTSNFADRDDVLMQDYTRKVRSAQRKKARGNLKGAARKTKQAARLKEKAMKIREKRDTDKRTPLIKNGSKKLLKKVSSQLKAASKKHAGQAAKIDKATSAMKLTQNNPKRPILVKGRVVRKVPKDGPIKPSQQRGKRKNNSAMKKISGPCKAAAKRKFKVWPSAYASGWGVRCTKAGGPSKFGG